MTTPSSAFDKRRFATTRWSRVVAATSTETAGAALGELISAYWYPLYAYARRRGVTKTDAEDLIQSYFTHLLDGNRLQQATQERGRFRSFLLAALRNFLANQWRSQAAQKRGGGVQFVSLDFSQAEDRYAQEPVDCETPQQLFDRRWAITLMDNALGRVQQLYERSGKLALFSALKEYLAGGETEMMSTLAEQLSLSENGVRVALHRLRKRCRSALRAEVARTIESAEDVDQELSVLVSQLG